MPYEESGRLNSCYVASLSRSEPEKPLVPEKTPAVFPFTESKDYYGSKSDSVYCYDNDELPLHIPNAWAERSELQFEDASLDGFQDPNPRKKLRDPEKDASMFVRMEDLELHGSCLDYQDEDAQIIGQRSGASPITTEMSESSVFPHIQSHSTSETFSIDSGFEIVQDESYLRETPEVTKRLIFTTKQIQNSANAETPLMFNGGTTRVTARPASLPNKRKASAPIKLWFDAHLEWPYPSPDDEIAFAKDTGLTIQQVRTCFTNLRARRKAKTTDMEISNPSIPLSVGRHNNQSDNDSRLRHTITQISELGCLETGDFVSRLDKEFTSSSLSFSAEVGTPSASSTTISSSPSQDLGPPIPYYDLNSKPGRKGKRLPPPSLKASAGLDKPHALCAPIQAETPKDKKTFHCIFCRKPLKDRYEWKRHEATHVAAMKWTCMPENSALWQDSCAFCHLDSPSAAHLAKHNVEACLEKSVDARTFSRKDHLKQHVEQVHLRKGKFSTGQASEVLKSWGKDVDHSEFRAGILWCGFCKSDLGSWAGRVEHIAAHFQSGVTMQDWVEKQL